MSDLALTLTGRPPAWPAGQSPGSHDGELARHVFLPRASGVLRNKEEEGVRRSVTLPVDRYKKNSFS